jgi:beta-phosphoglucomutase
MKTTPPQFQVRALLFDLDGTVVDNSEAHYQAWRELGAQSGKTISRDEYARLYLGKNTREVVETIWHEQPSDAALQDLYEQKLALYSSFLLEYGRVVNGFTELHARAQVHGLPIALVTSATPKSRQTTLEAFGLEDTFGCIVGVDHGLPIKPDPAMYQHAAAQLGVPAQDCVIFEDSPLGLQAGLTAGMKAVGVTTTHDANGLTGADFAIDDYGQLDFVATKNGSCLIGKK